MWLVIYTGGLGAFASAIGKLSIAYDSALIRSYSDLCALHFNGDRVCKMTSFSLRIAGFLLMLALNAHMVIYAHRRHM
jgi:hypothetical protein